MMVAGIPQGCLLGEEKGHFLITWMHDVGQCVYIDISLKPLLHCKIGYGARTCDVGGHSRFGCRLHIAYRMTWTLGCFSTCAAFLGKRVGHFTPRRAFSRLDMHT